MPARRPEYWKTPFGQWVDEYGASRIVAELAKDPELAVTREAVTHWLSGVAAPRPSHAFALVALSQGRLTLEDIYGVWYWRRVRAGREQWRSLCKPNTCKPKR